MIEAFREVGQLRRYAAGFSEGAGILVLEKGEVARKRGVRIRAMAGEIRSVGRLLPGREAEGVGRLFCPESKPQLVSLSGVAGEMQPILKKLPDVPRLETGRLLGVPYRRWIVAGVSCIFLPGFGGSHMQHLWGIMESIFRRNAEPSDPSALPHGNPFLFDRVTSRDPGKRNWDQVRPVSRGFHEVFWNHRWLAALPLQQKKEKAAFSHPSTMPSSLARFGPEIVSSSRYESSSPLDACS
jgi:hypothetical protein